MKSSTRSNGGSVILKAFGKQMSKQMPETCSLLADVRRLSREYFERIHRSSSDGESNPTTRDTTCDELSAHRQEPCTDGVVSRR